MNILMFFPVSCPLALTCQASSHYQIIKSSEEDAHQQQVNFDKLLRRLKESNIEITNQIMAEREWVDDSERIAHGLEDSLTQKLESFKATYVDEPL